MARRNGSESAEIKSLFLGGLSGTAAGLLVVAIAYALSRYGSPATKEAVEPFYGWGLFTGLPMLMGFVASLVVEWRTFRSASQCIGAGTISLGLGAAILLVFAFEGVICLIMASPIVYGCTLVGVFFARAVREFAWSRGAGPVFAISVLVIAPLAMEAEREYQTEPNRAVTSSFIDIDASPEEVWTHIHNFDGLPQADELLFRTGIACPVETRTTGAGVGAARVCVLTTGEMKERITIWEPGRRLRFRVLETPATMKEMNPFGEVHAAHLHNNYIAEWGEFLLERLPSGVTRVTGTSSYSYRIYPAQYWGWWTDRIVRAAQLRVLRHIKVRAEAKKHRSQVALD